MDHKKYWSNSQNCFTKMFTKYNHIQNPRRADVFHGGHNSEPSHIFYYGKYIHIFRGLILRHPYITTKNVHNNHPSA